MRLLAKNFPLKKHLRGFEVTLIYRRTLVPCSRITPAIESRIIMTVMRNMIVTLFTLWLIMLLCATMYHQLNRLRIVEIEIIVTYYFK